MSVHSNGIKNEQLGMNYGTAANALRKQILFHLVQETGKDICHQCEERIETAKELSVEHRVPWLHSEDPVGLFFDIDNIAFSHLSCNSRASRGYKKYNNEEDELIGRRAMQKNIKTRIGYTVVRENVC